MQEIFEKNDLHILQEKIEIGNTGHVTNCYIVYDKNNTAVVIDPAYDATRIIKRLKEYDLTLNGIFLTHCHADHFAALVEILSFYDVKVYGHFIDLENINNEEVNCKEIVNVDLQFINTKEFVHLNGGETITIGDIEFTVINTPGHTKGSIVLYEKNSNVLFTGDTIFENTYGRTDLVTGSHYDMKNSLDKLFNTFDNVLCFPGHGNKFKIDDVKRKINLLLGFKEGENGFQ